MALSQFIMLIKTTDKSIVDISIGAAIDPGVLAVSHTDDHSGRLISWLGLRRGAFTCVG